MDRTNTTKEIHSEPLTSHESCFTGFETYTRASNTLNSKEGAQLELTGLQQLFLECN